MRPQVLLIFLTTYEESLEMLRGIAHHGRSHRPWQTFLDDEARSVSEPSWLLSKHWDGIISRHTTPEIVRVCAEKKIPLVDVADCAVFPGVPKIRPDNLAIGHMGAEHFLEKGYREFAFAGFSNEEWSSTRRDGFAEAVALGGGTNRVFDVEYPGQLTPDWDEEQITLLAQWIADLPKPLGLMACNDMRALQVIAATQMLNMMVPEMVAVVGANNETIRCELSSPPLSSVATNAFQSGYRAADTLALILDGLAVPHLDVRIDPVGVISRHSTDALAIEDKNVVAALSYIRENACRGLTVTEVLHHAVATRSQLEKKFRRYLGRSPQAEIRRVQIAKIRQLLGETEFPLKKIAELTGFDHVEYMCYLFKRTMGVAPGAFRKKAQVAPKNTSRRRSLDA